jgi:replicative DNA helicase
MQLVGQLLVVGKIGFVLRTVRVNVANNLAHILSIFSKAFQSSQFIGRGLARITQKILYKLRSSAFIRVPLANYVNF